MTAIVIPNIPDELHERLQLEAARHGRSPDQEALAILERALRPLPPLSRVTPVETLRPFSHDWLLEAMREGRE